MKDNLTITSYNASFREEVVKLLAEFWNIDTELADKFFQWKYLDNPWAQRPYIAVLLAGEKIVGMRGAYVLPLRLPSREDQMLAGFFGDSLILEDYRGHGHFHQLTEELMDVLHGDGIQIALNTSATEPVHKTSIKHGWISTDNYEVLSLKRDDPDQNQPLISQLEDILDCIQPDGAGLLHFTNKIYLKPILELVNRTQSDQDVQIHNDETYLRWRFTNPTQQYRFIYLFEGTAENADEILSQPLLGFLVIATNLQSIIKSGWIADWRCENASCLSSMLSLIRDINPYYELAVLSPENNSSFLQVFQDNEFVPQAQPSFPVRTLVRMTENTTTPQEETRSLLDQLRSKTMWRHSAINLDSV